MLNDYDDDEEDAGYELEEEEDDEDEVKELEGLHMVEVDMGSFFEPGWKFLSKVLKEYKPIYVDVVVVATECKHCARHICAECKHGTIISQALEEMQWKEESS